MKKVLIAIDYNSTAQHVAETGYAIAKAIQADIVLVHVFSEAAYYANEYSPIMEYKGNYTDGTVALVEDIKYEAVSFLFNTALHLGDENIKKKVLEGETTKAILSYSIECEASLIVMGSHRHKGIERFIVTDEAVHMVKHSTIPLLIIPSLHK